MSFARWHTTAHGSPTKTSRSRSHRHERRDWSISMVKHDQRRSWWTLAVPAALSLAVVFVLQAGVSVSAQGRGQGGPQRPADAQSGAPIDVTGYWVSLVTEDWRYRMVTPAKGDFASVPLNAEGRRVTDQW